MVFVNNYRVFSVAQVEEKVSEICIEDEVKGLRKESVVCHLKNAEALIPGKVSLYFFLSSRIFLHFSIIFSTLYLFSILRLMFLSLSLSLSLSYPFSFFPFSSPCLMSQFYYTCRLPYA